MEPLRDENSNRVFWDSLHCCRRGGYYPPETRRFCVFSIHTDIFVDVGLRADNIRPYGFSPAIGNPTWS